MSDSESSGSDLHSAEGDYNIKKEIHDDADDGWGFSLSGLSLPWKLFIALATLVVFGAVVFYLYSNFWAVSGTIIPGLFLFFSWFSHLFVDNNTNNTTDSLSEIFPKSRENVATLSASIMKKSKAELDAIKSMNNSLRTYENTIFALQVIEEKFGEVQNALSLLEMLHPDEEIRKASNEHILQLQGMFFFFF
jgi:hypothetical protein